MIVVDTNIIAYFLIRGKRSESIDRLFAKDPEWVAPRLWLDEFINILCTYERRKLLTKSETNELLHEATTLMEDCSYEVPSENVLAVARRMQCSGYDSQYIALAEELGVHLYTCDKAILNACPHISKLPT